MEDGENNERHVVVIKSLIIAVRVPKTHTDGTMVQEIKLNMKKNSTYQV